MKEQITPQETGIQCDNPSCDYIDPSFPSSEYKNAIGNPCPKCGEDLMTQEDYENYLYFEIMLKISNMLTEEEMLLFIKRTKGIELDLDSIDPNTEIGMTVDFHKELKVELDIKK